MPFIHSDLRILAELNVGDSAILRRMTEEKELLDDLRPMGIAIDIEIRNVGKGLWEWPITIETRGREVEISHKATAKLFVSQT